MTRLVVFLLALGIVLIFGTASAIALIAVCKNPALAPAILGTLAAVLTPATGGMWLALRERR